MPDLRLRRSFEFGIRFKFPSLQGTPLVQFIRSQTTIAASAAVTGFGFWSGLDVNLEFHPAVENSGVVFVRVDLPGQPRIKATVANRITGPRRTTLVSSGVAVEMVEHVLSALAGLKIDNCEVRVNQAEMPGMDGSSLAFVEALLTAGKIELETTRAITYVTQSVRLGDENSWIDIAPSDVGGFELEFQLDYPGNPAIGKQTFSSTIDQDGYLQEIAIARTFVLDSEAQFLREQGLGERVGYQDLLVFDHNGPIENSLRFENECARHKVLDMVGDFALLGTDIVGKFTAFKSGHRLNAQVVLELIRQHEQQNYQDHNHQSTSHGPTSAYVSGGSTINKNRLSA